MTADRTPLDRLAAALAWLRRQRGGEAHAALAVIATGLERRIAHFPPDERERFLRDAADSAAWSRAWARGQEDRRAA